MGVEFYFAAGGLAAVSAFCFFLSFWADMSGKTDVFTPFFQAAIGLAIIDAFVVALGVYLENKL